jgi:hypothetical protein
VLPTSRDRGCQRVDKVGIVDLGAQPPGGFARFAIAQKSLMKGCPSLTSRYIRIQLTGNAPLSLAEVEVFSWGSG